MIHKENRKDKLTFTLVRTTMNVGYNNNRTYGYIQKLVLICDDIIMETFQWPEELTLETHTHTHTHTHPIM